MESSAHPFEEQWKYAFNGAEASLPDTAWSEIEHTLNRIENESNRRYVVYYRRLAAVLLFIAVASATLFLLQWKNGYDSSQTKITSNSGTIPQSQSAVVTPESGEALRSNDLLPGNKQAVEVTDDQSGRHQDIVSGELNSGIEPIALQVEVQEERLVLAKEESTEQSISEENNKPLTEEEEEALVKKLLGEDESIIPEKKKKYNSMWTGVGISGGSFSPDAAPSASGLSNYALTQSSNGVSPSSNQTTGGTAYSFGVMMGKQVSKHWIVQTGITYLKQNVDYESNVVASTAAGLVALDVNSLQNGLGTTYLVTNPYTLNSMTEYLSIPIQFGYVLMDRKVGLAVNSGVSTDLFLQNTLTDKSGTYFDASQSAGGSSAYRTVSWSGITNIELSMFVSGNFKVSAVPGIRYSFSNIMNENSGFQQPFILDLGVRCRYIFK